MAADGDWGPIIFACIPRGSNKQPLQLEMTTTVLWGLD